MSSTEIKLGPKDIVFPILGPTRAGKSTFINVALGQKVPSVGHSTTSRTKQPLPKIINPIPNRPELKGYRLVLLDTPGFDDTHEQDIEILKRGIAKWLEPSRRKGALVSGVLYFHDISADRFPDRAEKVLLMFSRLCSTYNLDAVPKTMLVTTKWPSDRDALLEQREEEMKGKHWKTLIEKGLEVRRFQPELPSSAWDVINLLLHLIDLSFLARELGPKDIVFPVMGPTGAGKSTFINLALGQNIALVGHSTTSCTKQPLPVIIDAIPNCPDSLRGYRMVLLDTPGFDDTHEEDVEILKRIARWLQVSRVNGALVGGVLYFHDISAKRFTGTARQSLLMFSHLCGYEAMPKTVLVTTNWPSDPNAVNAVLERREEEMRGEHWKTLIEKGLDVRRFQRNRESALDIVGRLLQDIPSILPQRNHDDNSLDLQIQRELIKRGMAIPETAAGQELRYTLKQLLKMQQEAITLEESFARTGDREAKTNLENIHATIRKLQDQVQDLKVRLSLPQRFFRMFGRKSGKHRP